jgi:hypothetical protein
MTRVTEKQSTELRRSADYSGLKDYPAYNMRVICCVTSPSVVHDKMADKRSGDTVATQTIFSSCL